MKVKYIRWKFEEREDLRGLPPSHKWDTALFNSIQAAPKTGTPISFIEAHKLWEDEVGRVLFELHDPAGADRIFKNFVPYIQSRGFYIELHGDEYEWIEVEEQPPAPPKVSVVTVTFAGTKYRIITSPDRPAIRSARILSSTEIELRYDTGETERALACNGGWYVQNLIRETLQGKTRTISRQLAS
jgi:hypothetical protein